jgi:hypothetical protein
MYKVKVKCGGQLIAENGQLELGIDESVLFEPGSIKASLPDGSQVTLQVRCGNQIVCGKKKPVTDRPVSEGKLSVNEYTGSLPQIAGPNKFYHSSLVGRNHFAFNSIDLKNNEELVRTMFGFPGRMHRCVRCQALGGSLYSCRVQRQHSNPDYDLVENFKGTSGVESFLNPWKRADEEGARDMTDDGSNDQNTSDNTTNLQHPTLNNQEEAKRADVAEKATTIAKEARAARENLEKADKAHKLARYLHAQAILLSDAEVKLSEDFISTNFPCDPADNHYVFCIRCGCAGDLLICDGCPNVSHPRCAGLKDVPDGDWFCHKCTVKRALKSSLIVPLKDVENSNEDGQQVEESASGKDDYCVGDNSECEKAGSSANSNTSMRQGVHDEDTAKESICMETENSSSCSLNHSSKQMNATSNTSQSDHIEQTAKIGASIQTESPTSRSSNPTSNQTNELPKSHDTANEKELKTDVSVDKAPAAIGDTKLCAETEMKLKEAPAATNTETTKDQEQTKQRNDPEINDEEFDRKKCELDVLLTDLMNNRLPPKVKPVLQQDERRQEPEQEPEADGLDALGDTYVREFLSFLNIDSAKQLLSTKTGLIAKDLEIWRSERGMKPLSRNGYGTTVSMWKNVVRKANDILRDQTSRKNGNDKNNDNKVLSTNKLKINILQVLPSQAQKFCSFMGITDGEEFLSRIQSDLTRKYVSWRKKQNMSKLAGSSPRCDFD